MRTEQDLCHPIDAVHPEFRRSFSTSSCKRFISCGVSSSFGYRLVNSDPKIPTSKANRSISHGSTTTNESHIERCFKPSSDASGCHRSCILRSPPSSIFSHLPFAHSTSNVCDIETSCLSTEFYNECISVRSEATGESLHLSIYSCFESCPIAVNLNLKFANALD